MTGEMLQTIVVLLFVGLAVAYLWRVGARTLRGKGSCCGTTCGKRPTPTPLPRKKADAPRAGR